MSINALKWLCKVVLRVQIETFSVAKCYSESILMLCKACTELWIKMEIWLANARCPWSYFPVYFPNKQGYWSLYQTTRITMKPFSGYASFKIKYIICYNYGGTLGCQDNNKILMSIWGVGWKHFTLDSDSGLSVLHITLRIGKSPQSAGFSFDALSIINPNIISQALFPPTHLQKACVWLKITRTAKSASHPPPPTSPALHPIPFQMEREKNRSMLLRNPGL